ncbi:MAG: hypothetical protein ACYS7M_12075 [Planctomycetota bacterium]
MGWWKRITNWLKRVRAQRRRRAELARRKALRARLARFRGNQRKARLGLAPITDFGDPPEHSGILPGPGEAGPVAFTPAQDTVSADQPDQPVAHQAEAPEAPDATETGLPVDRPAEAQSGTDRRAELAGAELSTSIEPPEPSRPGLAELPEATTRIAESVDDTPPSTLDTSKDGLLEADDGSRPETRAVPQRPPAATHGPVRPSPGDPHGPSPPRSEISTQLDIPAPQQRVPSEEGAVGPEAEEASEWGDTPELGATQPNQWDTTQRRPARRGQTPELTSAETNLPEGGLAEQRGGLAAGGGGDSELAGVVEKLADSATRGIEILDRLENAVMEISSKLDALAEREDENNSVSTYGP